MKLIDSDLKRQEQANTNIKTGELSDANRTGMSQTASHQKAQKQQIPVDQQDEKYIPDAASRLLKMGMELKTQVANEEAQVIVILKL